MLIGLARRPQRSTAVSRHCSREAPRLLEVAQKSSYFVQSASTLDTTGSRPCSHNPLEVARRSSHSLPVGCAFCSTSRADTHSAENTFATSNRAILLHESFRHTLLASLCKSIVNTGSQTTSSTSCFSSTTCSVGKSSREANSTTRNDKALLRLHDTIELAIQHTSATKGGTAPV